MTVWKRDTLEKIQDIMMDVFELDQLSISEATTAHDIEEWDSLSYVRLMVAIERTFKIRFNNAEIESLNSVGGLIACIEGKCRKQTGSGA
jgi:acyl carrier protein